MKIARPPHSWSVSPRRAIAIQRELADKVVRTGTVRPLRLVAGADIAFAPGGEECIGGVVVWDVAERTIVERRTVRQPTRFPYVPGMLSFREAPVIIAALRKLTVEPDAFMFDGQGYAHPRRFGLACHVGVLIDRPAIGVAKSVLIGEYETPRTHSGATSPLIDDMQWVGAAVRTRDNVKPVFVSVGHRLSLEAAIEITLVCSNGYRLPEPTRLADQLVNRARSSGR